MFLACFREQSKILIHDHLPQLSRILTCLLQLLVLLVCLFQSSNHPRICSGTHRQTYLRKSYQSKGQCWGHQNSSICQMRLFKSVVFPWLLLGLLTWDYSACSCKYHQLSCSYWLPLLGFSLIIVVMYWPYML